MYKSDVFDKVTSMSGSLLFPNFKEYCLSNRMNKLPNKIYLSLRDKEAKTRNPILKTVEDNTRELAKYFKSQGSEVVFEINQGNHFNDITLYCANGIKAILD